MNCNRPHFVCICKLSATVRINMYLKFLYKKVGKSLKQYFYFVVVISALINLKQKAIVQANMKAQIFTSAVLLAFPGFSVASEWRPETSEKGENLTSDTYVKTSSCDESSTIETTSVKSTSCEESTTIETSLTPDCDSSTKEAPSSSIPITPVTTFSPPHTEVKNETSCETKTTVITTWGTIYTTGYKVVTTTKNLGTTTYTTLCPLPTSPSEATKVIVSTPATIPVNAITTSSVYHNVTGGGNSTVPSVTHFEGIANLQKASYGAVLAGIAGYMLL